MQGYADYATDLEQRHNEALVCAFAAAAGMGPRLTFVRYISAIMPTLSALGISKRAVQTAFVAEVTKRRARHCGTSSPPFALLIVPLCMRFVPPHISLLLAPQSSAPKIPRIAPLWRHPAFPAQPHSLVI